MFPRALHLYRMYLDRTEVLLAVHILTFLPSICSSFACHCLSVVIFSVKQLSSAFAAVLDGSVEVNAAGDLTRKTGTKRRYSMINRGVVPAPSKVKAPLASIESISDGSHFKPKKNVAVAAPAELDDCNQYFCCNSKCNRQWGPEALSRTRNKLERYGKGTQTVRKVFVRECIASETRQLHIRDGMNALAVCWRFYRALMGVSFNLIKSAGGLGPVKM